MTADRMNFIDPHTHLYTEEFNDARAEAVERALAAGATGLLLPNIDEASVPRMLDMCARWPELCHPMMGLHPTELPDDPWPTLRRMRQWLETPAHPYIAIGEVGIDLYWDASRREEQIEVLRHQTGWAVELALPLVVHARAAHREIVSTLQPFADRLVGGVFHCFGGNEEEASELLTRFPRFVLGIGGVVTFKKSTLPEVLRTAVPIDRIVVETDAPYLAPAPHRGRRNESAYIPDIIRKIAEIYGTSAENVALQTTQTARRIFTGL